MMGTYGEYYIGNAIIGKNVTIFHGAVIGRKYIPLPMQVHPDTNLFTPAMIGDNSIIGANAVIYEGAVIGHDSYIGDTACISRGVTIGDRSLIAQNVTINCYTKIGNDVKINDGCYLTGYSTVEDGVFLGSLITFASDNTMQRHVKNNLEGSIVKGPTIKKYASIGQGVCINPNIIVGENAMVGSGAVVTKDVPAQAVVYGNPAKFIRWLTEKEIIHD